MLLSNYFLVIIGLGRHGDGIVLMCAVMVVCGGEWWRCGGIDDVRCLVLFPHDVEWCCYTWGWLSCYHAATSRWWWTNVCCHVFLPHDVGWCCLMVLYWCAAMVVAKSRWFGLMFLCRALPSWWCMMMLIWGWLLWLLITAKGKFNSGRIKFCWVNERRKYRLPWLWLPPTLSLPMFTNAMHSLIVWITASDLFVLSVDHVI